MINRKINSARYYQRHKEKIKESSRKYKQNHTEYYVEYMKQWSKNNPEAKQQWRERNPNKVRELNARQKYKRRSLGFYPLNEYFDGAEAHHISKNFVIYIPKEIHRSIWHNLWTGKNMSAMNKLAIEFI